MTAAAYVLMQELRLGLAGTASAQAQVSTLRTRFLKIGAQALASVRRIVLHLPRTFPYLKSFHRVVLSLGGKADSSPLPPKTKPCLHSYPRCVATRKIRLRTFLRSSESAFPSNQNLPLSHFASPLQKFSLAPLFINNADYAFAFANSLCRRL
jgi:hypothetical protein